MPEMTFCQMWITAKELSYGERSIRMLFSVVQAYIDTAGITLIKCFVNPQLIFRKPRQRWGGET